MNHTAIVLTKFKKSSLFLALTLGVISVTACSPTDNKTSKDKASTSPASGVVTTTASTQSTTTTGKKPVIYTTTTMWAAIAKAVGGNNIDVVTAIDAPNQDPHEYQASAQDKLAMQNANLVLVNGGGYDDWALSVADSLPKKPNLINAFALSGFDKINLDKSSLDKSNEQENDHAGHDDHEHQHGEVNEHVFYSLDTAKKIANSIAEQLASSDPANKTNYLQNAQAFTDKITCLKTKAQSLAAANKSVTQTAIATESVSDYLLADMGIKNITPPTYIAQSETEAGVSAKVLLDTKNLLSSKKASLLVLNAQTEDSTAKQLVESAKSAGVGTVDVYETLPAGETSYVGYMNGTINRFNTAINGANAKPLAECQ